MSFSAQAQVVIGEHVDAELVAEMTGVTPGQDTWIALRLDHMENWHTYWKNPGDAGRATEINWTLPDGVTAGEIVWPTPKRLELPADLVDFGYEDEIYLQVSLNIPASFQEENLDISGNAQWLECEYICIPGGAVVSLSLPILEESQITQNEQWIDGFALTRAAIPTSDVSFGTTFSIADGNLNILIQATEAIFENASAIRFIPGEHRVFDYISPQEVTYQLSSLQLTQGHHPRLSEAPEEITGLLLVTDDEGQLISYEIAAAPDGINASDLGLLAANADTLGSTSASDMSLLLVFTFALLGGLILNLMPCVFPVLSLKVLSLASSSNSTQHEKRLHGLAYTAGVIAAFLILASVLLALQAGGTLIGWGFHLQSPWFISLLIFLFFVLGLSMSGVVEFGTSIMGVSTELQDKDGYSGSFFTGILASVVASPCTAPFMGAALGFAFTQTAIVALAVFFALGLGMALPFVLISFNPTLSSLLPHPGKWMLTFKQVLAFPLYATVVWLLWVLGNQTGTDGMALVIATCVLLAMAAWLYQRRLGIQTPFWRYANAFIILLCLVTTIGVVRSPLLETQSINQVISEDAGYEAYSDARLAELRSSGQPVFVNMTASWCITCLVNEKVALNSEEFTTALADKNVTYLKGDWTNNDPEITEVLRRYETSGVPLYLMFPADSSEPAEVLPQILTTNIIIAAINRI
ncbi:MAG: protein-disulfide reductase DsbD family protein [Gammaproteobacteria bacterium]|nr:protein-disulfide reductase DsbD family protein [Gammaproteobacteria bacterium]